MTRTTCYTRVPSPIGSLLLVSDGEALTGLHMEGSRDVPASLEGWVPDPAPFAEVGRQLAAYFGGELERFDLMLRPQGTPFQRRVWDQLLTIPTGETVTYRELAHRVGSPKGARAAGAATGRNPIAVVIPCHRVVGSNGALVGFGGGLPRKRYLLELEGGMRG